VETGWKTGRQDQICIAYIETRHVRRNNSVGNFIGEVRELCSLSRSFQLRLERAREAAPRLERDVAQVLWDSAHHLSSAVEIIQLLEDQFGGLNQCERYRAELRNVTRRRGDTLQVLYQEVRQLMLLAFPGQSGPLLETLARDSFLDALADPDLRM
jgi:hypothetical protein